jgi:hypothetical protein
MTDTDRPKGTGCERLARQSCPHGRAQKPKYSRAHRISRTAHVTVKQLWALARTRSAVARRTNSERGQPRPEHGQEGQTEK